MNFLTLLGLAPQLIGVVSTVVGLIHKQEATAPAGTSGAQKKASVLSALADVGPLVSTSSSFDLNQFLAFVGEIIDGVVGIAHMLGIFQHNQVGEQVATPAPSVMSGIGTVVEAVSGIGTVVGVVSGVVNSLTSVNVPPTSVNVPPISTPPPAGTHPPTPSMFARVASAVEKAL